ncbi:MAG: redox-regulated ATPase YchF [Candidatus Methanofastidiosa archaeon]|nr:redox-regulated ATPase YchF [Candidatus Methanofastidiosa archaeon]MDD4281716.1 redox-regulated ATPase YchF [Candidatus Methanofastidiosa archaeon]
MEIGIVGKPNVGKSTFFNACTHGAAEMANYPFTTIASNTGVTYVTAPCPCTEFNVVCEPRNARCVSGVRLVPTTIIDVAGIVPGAHEGKGLGNQFLDDIRRASVLIHVVDASGSTDEGGNPVNKGAHDPLEDVAFLEREIDLWFASVFSRHWEKVSRKIALTNKNIFQVVAENFSGIGIGEEDVHGAVKDAGLDPERPRVWTEDDITSFAMHIRTRTKPIVIAANKADIADDDQIAALQKGARNVVPVSAGAELLLRKARDASLIDYVPGESDFSITGDVSQKQGEALERVRAIMRRWGSTGVQSCINTAVFDILDRIVVYPVENEKRLCDGKGAVLPDALLLRRGATPMDLAEKIHSDIAKNYIYALNVRTNRRIAEDCELCSGDIIKIASAAR